MEKREKSHVWKRADLTKTQCEELYYSGIS